MLHRLQQKDNAMSADFTSVKGVHKFAEIIVHMAVKW